MGEYTPKLARLLDEKPVYAVLNWKGGVGKTTTTVSLAHAVSMWMYANGFDGNVAVMIIDYDPQGHVATSLGLKPEGRCVSDILLGKKAFDDVIMPSGRPGLFVIPATGKLSMAKGQIVNQLTVGAIGLGGPSSLPYSRIDETLTHTLSKLSKAVPVIFIDCPPTSDFMQSALYKFADHAIVPVRASDFLGVVGTRDHTNEIVSQQAAGIEIDIRAVIPTFVDVRNNLTRDVIETLKGTYGAAVTVPVPDTIRVPEAAANGRTIFEHAKMTGQRHAQIVASAYARIMEKWVIK